MDIGRSFSYITEDEDWWKQVLIVVMFIYALPLIVIAACSGAGLGIFSDAIRDPDAADTIGSIWGVCFGCFGALYGILLGVIAPFVYATYADTGELGAALKLGDIWGMFQRNIGPAFVVLLVTILAGLLASVAGLILCGIGLFATSFFANLVIAHAYGTLYREAKPAIA